MYRKQIIVASSITVNTATEGETIETKVERIVQNKEPIKDGAPLIYTEKKDGVGASYDIRTDRFEVACEAMDKITKSKIAKSIRINKENEEAKIIDMNKNQDNNSSQVKE